jgi:hypothetical protein
VGDYRVTFPAGTWSTFPKFPVMVLTPVLVPGAFPVVHTIIFSADGSAQYVISLSSTVGSVTPMDGYFSFNVSAPLTTGSSSLRTASVRRVILGSRAVRAAAGGRKGR